MTKFWAASALVAGLLGSITPSRADIDSVRNVPPRTCLQLTAQPEAPPRPSGREVRLVTYTVVRTLQVEDEVGHPAFFVYPHERESSGRCELPLPRGRGLTGLPAPRSHGDARQR